MPTGQLGERWRSEGGHEKGRRRLPPNALPSPCGSVFVGWEAVGAGIAASICSHRGGVPDVFSLSLKGVRGLVAQPAASAANPSRAAR